MAIVFRSKADNNNGAGAPTITATMPAGFQADDLLLIVINVAGNVTPTTPSGWTQRATRLNTNRCTLIYKIASGSETDLAVAITSAEAISSVLAWSGVDTTTPWDQTGTLNGASSATATATGLTTVTNDAMLLAIMAYTGGAFSTPGGMTERDDYNAAGNVSQAVFEELRATAGATGNRASTLDYGDTWNAFMEALRPAPDAGGDRFSPPLLINPPQPLAMMEV